MFNPILRSVLFTLIAIGSLVSAFAQSTPRYNLPREVDIEPFVRRNLQPHFGRSIYNQLSVEGFYPIGWSRDGKFAYYVEPVDQECGCYFAELRIQDLRTDTVVWEFKNDPQSRVDAKDEVIADDMRKVWLRNQKLFDEKLREHGVVPLGRFALLGKSFTAGGKAYTAKFAAAHGKDDDGTDRIRKISVEFSSPALGNKTLFTRDYGGEMYVSPLDGSLLGAFKSPYENRVAIILLQVQRGWEGPPNHVDIQIIGADLKGGFRR